VKNILLFVIVLFAINSFSQTTNKSVSVNFIDNPITLDAELSEDEWKNTKGASGFWQYFPLDSF
jgi:hypothetical protein